VRRCSLRIPHAWGELSAQLNLGGFHGNLSFNVVISGSSNGHSPVLNLSKTAGSGSVGEQSGSEAGASHRSQDDEEEDDNLSEDLEDDNEKDEGMISIRER